MQFKVPFYSNTPDDTHCAQASLRMVMKYFWPQRDFTWEELDTITAKVDGMATWPFAGNIWLVENGMSVQVIQMFDNQAFVDRGVEYIKEFAGQQVAKWQESHSDIPQAQELAKESMRKVFQEMRMPTIDDIKNFLEEGALVTCNVNSLALNQEEGYEGHGIVVVGYTDKGLYLHDPGLPPQENKFVENEIFEQAWAYPTEKIKNLTVYKL